MLKSTFRKTVGIVTIFSFGTAIMPWPAHAYSYRLTPVSFNEMYSMAENGEVESLREAVHRGLNIDVMNYNGDTGLCVAARRHDAYTYNSFRAAGANPRHPCTQTIYDYESFVNNSRAVSVTATPREAYGKMGKEKYRIAPIWWWIGGTAVVGGLLLLLLGGGGGGGGGDDTPQKEPSEDYNSLGAVAGTSGTIISKANGESLSLTERSLENSKYRDIKNENDEKITKIDLKSDALKNTEFTNVVLKAENKGVYTNNTDVVIKAGSGVIGMNAVKEAAVNNYGYINVTGYNSGIGMVASEGSFAYNHGKGIVNSDSGKLGNNGISLNFSGYDSIDTLVGMYADTKSTLQNYGDIKGTAVLASEDPTKKDENGGSSSGQEAVKSSASTGTLIGMEAMIINTGKNLNKDVIKISNEVPGRIDLSAGDSGNSSGEIKVSLIGMGSFLDYGFMNDSKNINRAEKVRMDNYGRIVLGYTGNYTADATALRKGTGGIVGMRAEANTTAENAKGGNIIINLDEYSTGSSNVDVSAGMQSIHGGNLINAGDISITTSAGNLRRNYGMFSVDGSGTVSGLYTDLNQKLENSGNINIQAGNSFGMASLNGGTLTNSGYITMGKADTTTYYDKNIAMYGYGKTKETSLENLGTIDIYSHNSVAMQNDFAGGTSIYNKGTVNIHDSATDSYVFGGAYSEAHNSNIINYEATTAGTASSASEDNYDPFKNYTLSIGNSILSSKSRSALGYDSEISPVTTSSTEKIFNDKNSVINMKGSSYIAAMTVDTDSSSTGAASDSGKVQGKAYNNGTIRISDSGYRNATNTVGMYLKSGTLSSALIENNGLIDTDSAFSAAMASESTEKAPMINNGTITANGKQSLGMYYTGVSKISNTGSITVKGNESIAVLGRGSGAESEIENTGTVTVKADGTSEAEKSYGIYIDSGLAEINNRGLIDIYTKTAGAAVYNKSGSSAESAVKINNYNIINVNGNDTWAVYNSGYALTLNETGAVINVGKAEKPVSGSYGIYYAGENSGGGETSSSGGSIINRGTINLYGDGVTKSYAIYSGGSAEITDEGDINLNGENSTAIYAGGGKAINKKTINITHDKNNGLEGSGSVQLVNDTNAVINVGSEENSVSNSSGMAYGIDNKDTSGGVLENNGVINLYSKENGNSRAVLLAAAGTFNNNKSVISYNDNSSAVYASAAAIINNKENAEITVYGSGVHAVEGTGDNGLTVTNDGKITAGTEGTETSGNYGISAETAASFKNNKEITVYGDNSYGIYAKKGTSAENKGTITLDGAGSTAVYGGELTTVANSGDIKLSGTSAKGIHTTGSGTVTNSKNIILEKAGNGNGIYTEGEGTVENTSDGVIQLGSASVSENAGNGIYAKKSTSVTNNGKITVSNGNGILSEGDNASVKNTKEITLLQGGDNSGISAKGKDAEVENSGNISVSNSEGYGSARNNSGIYTEKAKSVTNSGNITVYGNYSYGINGSTAETVNNEGKIYVNGRENRYGIYTSSTEASVTITNSKSGGIYIEDTDQQSVRSGNYGIYSDNLSSTIENYGNLVVGDGNGIYIKKGEITNNNGIYVTRGDGIIVSDSGTITNDVQGVISSEEGDAIVATTATEVINNGEITAKLTGMAITNSSSVQNFNKISADRIVSGEAAVVSAGDISNNEKAKITVSVSGNAVKTETNVTNSTGATISTKSGTAVIAKGDVTNALSATISSESGRAVENASSLTNSGTIRSGKGSAVYNVKTVTNSKEGTISANGKAIERADSVTNTGGHITASTDSVYNYAIDGTGNSNSGTITVANSEGGEITGSGYAIRGFLSSNVTNGVNSKITVSSGDAVVYVGNNSTINNSGTISGTATYGVQSDGLGSTFANSQSGKLQIDGNGAAVYGFETVSNEGDITINGNGDGINGGRNITNNGTITVNGNGRGIYSEDPRNITNNGKITVTGSGTGIYAEVPDGVSDQFSITNGANGVINVQSGKGMYIEIPKAASKVNITNAGQINVNGDYAIFIKKNYALNASSVTEGEGDEQTTTITYTDNTNVDPGTLQYPTQWFIDCVGDHCINGEQVVLGGENNPSGAKVSLFAASDPSLLRNIKLVNSGKISVSGDVDFGSEEEGSAVVSVGKNGTYEADSFSGTVKADAEIVKGGFETSYVNENSFIGKNDGLKVVSDSYLFDAKLMSNENGGLNVVMTMSPFEEKVQNSRIAGFLSENYKEQRGETVFDILKGASDKTEFDGYLNKELGFAFVPDLARQSLDIEKTAGAELNSELTAPAAEKIRRKVNIMTYKNETDQKHEITGYKDKVTAAYGFADKAFGKLRLGIGLTALRSDSDFDDDSTRYNNMLEVSAPAVFRSGSNSALFKPKAGFARGHYRRSAVNTSYKAKTKEYYYGFDTEVRHSTDLKTVVLEPNAGFNLTGLYTDDIKESRGGLRIKDNNTLSALVYAGMDLKKEFVFNRDNSLSFIAGGKYFHEAGDRYSADVTVGDMLGTYDIRDGRLQRNYGLISLKAVYGYKTLSVSASANAPLEQKRKPYFMLNMGYKF